MAIPNKGITAATAVHNKFAPFAERWIGNWHCAETSGDTLANIGVRNAYGGFDPGAASTKIGSGSLTFVDAATDPINGPYVLSAAGTSSAGAAPALYTNASGSTVTFTKYTFHMRFIDPNGTPGAERTIFSNGSSATATAGKLVIARTAADGLAVRVGTETFTFTSSQIDWTVGNSLVVFVGNSTATRVILNRYNLTLDTKGGMQVGSVTDTTLTVANGRSLLCAAIQTATTSFQIGYSHIGFCDKRLDMYPESNKDIAMLLGDPWLLARPAPSIDTHYSTAVSAMTSRVTATTAMVSLTSGHGDTGLVDGVLGGSRAFKVHYGTSSDPTSANFCNEVAQSGGVATAEIKTLDTVTLTDLVAGTEYFYWVGTTDDDFTTEYPLPGGLHRFRYGEQPNFYADDHVAVVPGVWGYTLAAIRYGAANYTQNSAYPAAFACERAIHYNVLHRRCDFSIIAGDFYMGDSWKTSEAVTPDIDDRNNLIYIDASSRAAWYRNFCHRIFSDGEVKVIIGNHEGEAGYSQNDETASGTGQNNGAYQAICTNVRKSYFPGQTDGENEGDPASTTVSWVPGDTGIFNTYGYADYKTDYITGTSANPRGLNKSPLENYYAFERGSGLKRTLWIIGDPYRYTEPGDPDQNAVGGTGGIRTRLPGRFTFGETQLAWIEATLAASTAPKKFFVTHQHPGGVVCGIAANINSRTYGRNCGLTELGAEMLRIVRALRAANATAWISGHDHRFFHGIGTGPLATLNQIKLPSGGAPSMSGDGAGGDGWHFGEMEGNAGYGLQESLGADLVTLGDGLGTAQGNLVSINVMGVATIDIVDGDPIVKMVATEWSRDQDGDGKLTETMLYNERHPGKLLTAASDVVTLPTVPRTVQEAYLAADVSLDRTGTPFWSTPPTSQRGADVGPYVYDWDQPTGVVTATLNTSNVNNNPVYVFATPMELYSATLGPASAVTGGRSRGRHRGRGGFH